MQLYYSSYFIVNQKLEKLPEEHKYKKFQMKEIHYVR